MKSQQSSSDFSASVGEKIRPLTLGKIDSAIRTLTHTQNSDIAIHTARKCLKSVRAYLRLIRSEIGETRFHRENRTYRNIGKPLSNLRDAATLIETIDFLRKKNAQMLTEEEWENLKTLFLQRANRVDPKKKNLISSAVTKIKAAKRKLTPHLFDSASNSGVEKGFHRTFKKARRAMKTAFSEPSAANFHEWRKQVGYLRHQNEALPKIWLSDSDKFAGRCKKLAKLLGKKNDLAVLVTTIEALQPKVELQELQVLYSAISEIDQEIAEKARKIGKKLFRKRKPKHCAINPTRL